jgi:hypothetical protein
MLTDQMELIHTAVIFQSFFHTTRKQYTSPGDFDKIQQSLEFAEKCCNDDLLSIKLQRTPIVIRLSETLWKYRLGLASNQHLFDRMFTFWEG